MFALKWFVVQANKDNTEETNKHGGVKMFIILKDSEDD